MGLLEVLGDYKGTENATNQISPIAPVFSVTRLSSRHSTGYQAALQGLQARGWFFQLVPAHCCANKEFYWRIALFADRGLFKALAVIAEWKTTL